MSTTEMLELRRTVDNLRHCVASLQSLYGDAPAVRRLVNDVERLEIDYVDLEVSPPHLTHHRPVERIQVPDTPYDASMWQGADDEGVGGHPADHDT
ncbi:hypothetical protein [Rhodococcus sp. ARC_M6]|uniref:hypothetical protein n=1 Tax=Rhodococcus sp. ARC_M6 TaxID=2928852 RepID=UPI001FB25E9A|nr:hypothetical protein [Rhodococcus sp. ARC_M6]MCJ0907361.1 hypothetical protein [Rhodococcus sp. ARC_M6]